MHQSCSSPSKNRTMCFRGGEWDAVPGLSAGKLVESPVNHENNLSSSI